MKTYQKIAQLVKVAADNPKEVLELIELENTLTLGLKALFCVQNGSTKDQLFISLSIRDTTILFGVKPDLIQEICVVRIYVCEGAEGLVYTPTATDLYEILVSEYEENSHEN
jgi:hypothetical protein